MVWNSAEKSPPTHSFGLGLPQDCLPTKFTLNLQFDRIISHGNNLNGNTFHPFFPKNCGIFPVKKILRKYDRMWKNETYYFDNNHFIEFINFKSMIISYFLNIRYTWKPVGSLRAYSFRVIFIYFVMFAIKTIQHIYIIWKKPYWYNSEQVNVYDFFRQILVFFWIIITIFWKIHLKIHTVQASSFISRPIMKEVSRHLWNRICYSFSILLFIWFGRVMCCRHL